MSNKKNNFKQNQNDNFKNKMKNISKEMKSAFKITTYTKEFESFEDGINEMCDISTYINTIFSGESVSTPTEASKVLYDLVAENFPDVTEGKNMFWSINMAANKCVVKTNSYISFGWTLKYKRNPETKQNEISNIKMQIAILREDADITRLANELGWSSSENK